MIVMHDNVCGRNSRAVIRLVAQLLGHFHILSWSSRPMRVNREWPVGSRRNLHSLQFLQLYSLANNASHAEVTGPCSGVPQRSFEPTNPRSILAGVPKTMTSLTNHPPFPDKDAQRRRSPRDILHCGQQCSGTVVSAGYTASCRVTVLLVL
jgi:hypothetical protein